MPTPFRNSPPLPKLIWNSPSEISVRFLWLRFPENDLASPPPAAFLLPLIWPLRDRPSPKMILSARISKLTGRPLPMPRLRRKGTRSISLASAVISQSPSTSRLSSSMPMSLPGQPSRRKLASEMMKSVPFGAAKPARPTMARLPASTSISSIARGTRPSEQAACLRCPVQPAVSPSQSPEYRWRCRQDRDRVQSRSRSALP